MCLVINRKDFTKLMVDYGFSRFPRTVGKPDQYMIHDFDAFIFFFKYNYGKTPLFTSTNSYWDLNEIGNPTNIYYEKLFFDMDTDTGYTQEEAHKEIRIIAKYCNDNKIPCTISFSGLGFHFFMFFKPKIYTLDENLSRTIKGVANYIKEELKLKTANLVCAEPKRLVRIPLSKYVTKKEGEDEWNVTNRNCIPLTYDQVMNLSTEEIKQLSSNFKTLKQKYRTDGNSIFIKDFIKDNKIDITKKVIMTDRSGVHMEEQFSYDNVKDDDIFKIVQFLIPFPCLSRNIFDKNPPHFIRFSACAFLSHNSILNKDEALNLFDKISIVAEWNDRQNTMTRRYQIENIYSNPEYDRYSCEKMNMYGCCIGKDCKYYAKYLEKVKLNEIADTRENKEDLV